LSETEAIGLSRWLRQVRAMLGLELRKTFLRPRALPVVVDAFLPVILLALRMLATRLQAIPAEAVGDVAQTYGVIFQLFFVRLVVFFGCFGIFTYLIRGEMLERSLHFYFLAPLRRDVFVVGKYLAGVVAGSALFGTSVLLQIGLCFLTGATPGGRAYLLSGPGAGQAMAYLGVTVLAVIGYGAVFLALGMLVKNPMIPAALILGWEWINFLLPPALKKLSVIHYLQSLCPVPVPHGPFALPAEPTPAVLALLGLLALAAALLFFASRRAASRFSTRPTDGEDQSAVACKIGPRHARRRVRPKALAGGGGPGRHAGSRSVEGGDDGAWSAAADGVRRAARDRRPLAAPGASRPHPAAHRPGQRGLSQVAATARHSLARSSAFLRLCFPDHASHPGRSCPRPSGGEARSRSGTGRLDSADRGPTRRRHESLDAD
jgi:hypothetical protein